MYKHSKGITLLELMIGIVILAIIAGIAIPNMQDFIQRSRIIAITQEFVGSLDFAKSEAVKSGQSVSVCPIGATQTTCSDDAADWVNNGWRVFVTNTNQQLAVNNAVSSQVSITSDDGSSNEIMLITYQSSGFPSVGAGDFAIQADSCVAQNRREINLSPTGRLTVQPVDCAP